MSDMLLTDLALTRRDTGALTADRDGVDLREAAGDLLLAEGRRNLAQALLNRLYTRRGALAALGHPGYGSRLHSLVGEPDSRRTRALAELYVREALTADRRVKEVSAVSFQAPESGWPLRHTLAMTVGVLPLEGPPLAVSVAANLGG